MNKLHLITVFSFAVVVTGCVATTPAAPGSQPSGQATQKKWTCQAPNMISGYYLGDDYAYIQIAPYSGGRRYPVVKTGDTATGITGNGTEFVCKEK